MSNKKELETKIANLENELVKSKAELASLVKKHSCAVKFEWVDIDQQTIMLIRNWLHSNIPNSICNYNQITDHGWGSKFDLQVYVNPSELVSFSKFIASLGEMP